jgi:hypothetical protein
LKQQYLLYQFLRICQSPFRIFAEKEQNFILPYLDFPTSARYGILETEGEKRNNAE